MAKKQRTAKQLAADKAGAERLRAVNAAKKSQNQKPQTNTSQTNNQPAYFGTAVTESVAPAPEQPQAPTAQPVPGVTLSPEQLNQLIAALTAGQTTDKAAAPSMTPGVGMQGNLTAQGAGLRTNQLGQLVGTEVRWNIDPTYYPNPIDQLYDEFERDNRTRRLGLRDNYFLTWDIDSKPYDTKYGVAVQEPFFHMTLYMNLFDDQGLETGKAIIVQTLHFNEDQSIALELAAENDWDVNSENIREVMDLARYERVKRWLLGLFFPERTYQPSEDAREEAIGGQVVKVITKSAVKGFGNKAPVIDDEELI